MCETKLGSRAWELYYVRKRSWEVEPGNEANTSSLPHLNGRILDAGEAVLCPRADIGVDVPEKLHQEAETMCNGGLRR